MSLTSRKVRAVAAVLWSAALLGCGPTAPRVERVEWPEMGTVAALSVRGASPTECGEMRGAVRTVYASLAAKLNAWNPESELSRLTTTNGWAAHVSPEVRPCYAAAFQLMAESERAFNPLLAAELRARGFTRNAVLVDLGAIAKGFAVDCAYAALLTDGPAATDFLLDLGGNLRAGGGVWTVGVRNPFGSGLCATVELHPGEALATSGTYARGNHILDGRTGETAASGVASVTVLAPSAMLADGLSTTLFVLGVEDGRQFLARHYPTVCAFWVLSDGRAETFDTSHRFSRQNP